MELLEIVYEREATYRCVATARVSTILVCFIAQEHTECIAGTVGDIDMSAERH